MTRGTRWSLVLFFFSSCKDQLKYTSQVLPEPLQQRIHAARTGTPHGHRAERHIDARLKLPRSLGARGGNDRVAREAVRTGIPRWLAAAAAEAGPLPVAPDSLGFAGPLSCPPGTAWSPSAESPLLGHCTFCTAGMFSPRHRLVGPSTLEAPLLAPACRPCRAGFFSP